MSRELRTRTNNAFIDTGTKINKKVRAQPPQADAPRFCSKEALCEKGLEKDEFEKVKIQRETGAVLGGETTFDIMRLMGKYYLLTGRPVTYRSLVKKMEKMTVSDVTDAFNDIIDYDKAGICYVGKPVEVDLGKLFRSGGI